MSTKNEIGIIFIPGAGLNGEIWHGVIEHLDIPCVSVDYSTLRQSKGLGARLSDYVSVVNKQAAELNTSKVVVVGHSIGGVVGQEVLRHLGNRAVGFIGVSAVIPKPGSSFVSSFPLIQRLLVSAVLKIAGTKPPDSTLRAGLGTDLTEEQTEKVVRDYQQESKWLYFDKTSHTPIHFEHISTFYIRTLKDKELVTKVQDTMIGHLPEAKTFDINSGHMPMLSHPKLVAQHITRAMEEL